MKHDELPEPGELSADDLHEVEVIRNSAYAQNLRELSSFIAGKTVIESEAGSSGFLLRFSDRTWSLCFVEGARLSWKVGQDPTPQDRLKLMCADHADGTDPLDVNVPYADETCDVAAEVAKCHGEQVTGLAIGERTFNICFPAGRELETSIWQRSDGKLAFRVFWEQW
jgi:hypothetical protein